MLWHGDHRWHGQSARIAEALAGWADSQGLGLTVDAAPEGTSSEIAARGWRYAQLAARAGQLGCTRVVTAHTASDRAETLILNLARGCDRRGLCPPRLLRPLRSDGVCRLARPLLMVDRRETALVCRERGLPVWKDPGNADLRRSRNRVRHQVMPVLEHLHPGADRRMSALCETIGRLQAPQDELISLALRLLEEGPSPEKGDASLRRDSLRELSEETTALLLHYWLRFHTGSAPARQVMNQLVRRLLSNGAAGKLSLPGPWQLRWTRFHVHLERQNHAEGSRLPASTTSDTI